MLSPLLFFGLAAIIPVLAAPSRLVNRAQYPFSQIVVFGDNLSDNGNGSVANGVADANNPTNSIYGFNTWTDGPIMASYLSSLLGVPLLDYAFGHADGGSKFGATIDNSYTQSTANAPSSKDQIANYTSSSNVASARNSLHFLWIGANDINLYHIGTSSDADNSDFAKSMSTMLAEQVQSLFDAGAVTVVVPNLYPKHISPSKEFYASDDIGYQVLGEAISGANDAIKNSLAQFGDKVIYYDVFNFMLNIWNNHESYNITHVGGEFCDGYSQQDWDLCVTDGEGNTFYWMQFLDMTTTIHKMIAQDLFTSIQQHYSGSSQSSPSSSTATATSTRADFSATSTVPVAQPPTPTTSVVATSISVTPTSIAEPVPSDQPEPDECDADE